MRTKLRWGGHNLAWRRIAVVLAAAVTFQAGLPGIVQALPQASAAAPQPDLGHPVHVTAVPVGHLPPRHQDPAYKPTATHWPTAASSSLALGTTATRASAVPVWGQAVTGTGGAYQGPTSLGVKVLPRSAAAAAGVSGVLAQVTPAKGGRGKVRIGFDYSSFAQAYGGDYAQRLRLVELPACALTTPQVAACRVQTPLASSNDTAKKSVSATVTLNTLGITGMASSGSASTARAAMSGAAQSSTLAAPAASSGTMVMALTSSPSSGDGGSAGGQYGATSLKPSGSWSVGGSSGSFDYTYPITLPQAISSLTPSLELSYDSGSVDGQTAATQAQSSWVGDGWSTADNYIEQSFVSCGDQPEGVTLPTADQTGDMCYDGLILTMSLNGSSVSLLKDSNGKWHTSSDNGDVVTHVTGSNNGSGTYNTDYWTVTDTKGAVYEFGRNELPGWSSGKATTNSVDSEPVYSSQPGDPCYNATFTSAVCTMAYRWHLDYVKDVHGDAMAYYYQQDTNHYAGDNGAKNGSSSYSYVRDSHLDHIDYGFTDGNAYGTIPDKVVYATGDRCFTGTCDPLNSTNAPNWPDVPFDLVCAANTTCASYGPGFFSTVGLRSITTEQYNGTGYNTVDTYTLTQSIPTTGTYNTSTLRLESVARTGSDTTAGGTAPPPMTESFAYTMMANRVNYTTGTGSGLGPLNRYRLNQITTESNSVIGITYELVNACTPTSITTITASSNTASCFPVVWTPANQPITDWFNKYVVQSVSQSDPSGKSAGLFTQYNYVGGAAAWHYDDNELVLAKYRSYGQWRGYGDVQTLTGQGSDPVAESETWYYRGMDGDWLSSTSTRSISIKDSQGNSHTDSDQLAGDALETAQNTYNGGAVDHSTINSYWVSPATATRTRSGLPDLTANAVGQVEAWTRQAVTSGWRTTETDTSYDTNTGSPTFGLPLFSYNHGDLSLVGGANSQETCTQTTYAPANTSLNLTGLVAETETDDKPCGGISPAGASAPTAAQTNALTAPTSLNKATDVISDTRTFYDNPTMATTWPQPSSPTWPQAAPTKGDASVVQVANGYNGTAFTYQTKTAATFDGYGRGTATYDGDGNKTATAYTDTTYLTTTAVKTTNALNQSATNTLDTERGITLTTTDANGVVTTCHFDGLGRLIAVWKDSRSTGSAANLLYAYSYPASGTTAPVVVTTQTLNEESGYSTSTTLYDALMRVRQTQAQAVSTSAGRIIADTFYDTHGWVYKTNKNYYDNTSSPNGTLQTVADNQSAQQTLTSFDGLGRPTVVTSLDDQQVKATADTQYLGDRTITVPPTGGTATATVVDALGRTTETDQYATAPTVATTTTGGFTTASITGGTTQATKFTFNAQGRAYQTVDPNNDTWSTGYNFLGQQVTKTDPDAGTSGTTVYDAAGNVVQATDSATHTLSYTFDQLNRKTAEYDAPVSGQSTSNEVASWVYDNSNNVTGVSNAVGHLTTETSYTPAGTFTKQAKSFNVFGESTGETYTVPANGSQPTSYAYIHTYSTVTGLPKGTGVPATANMAAELVTTGYCTASGLDVPCTLGGANGYEQSVAYTVWGQVGQQVIGSSTNKASVTNTWDPNSGALTDRNVVNTAVSSTPMDDTSYGYDPAGNITAQTDVRGGTSTESQCYTYDPLDRLTQAWTTNTTASSCSTQPSTSTVNDGVAGGAYWTSWSFTGGQGQIGQPTTQVQHNLTGGTDTTTNYTYGGSDPSCTTTSSGAHTLATAATIGGATATNSYCYDGLGHTTSRTTSSGQQTLTWNDEGKLYQATTGTNTTSYYYDADGNVIETADPGSTTLFLPDQQITYFTSSQTTNTVRSYALPGGGEAVLSNTSYSFVLTDQHGTGTVSLDATAKNPTWQQYTPYGAPRGTAPGSNWLDPNGFLDKPQDTNTQLTTIGARQYDPTLGRFISLDPVLEPGTQQVNGYSYAGANPTTQADPTGLFCDGCGPSYYSGKSCSFNADGSSNGNCGGGASTSSAIGQVINTWVHKYSPKTDNINQLKIWWAYYAWAAGGNLAGDFWTGATVGEDGQTQAICFGRTACGKALDYLMQTGDVQGAKNIAAFYCVWNDCGHQAKDYTRAKKLWSDFMNLFLMGAGMAGGGEGVGGCSFDPKTPVLLANGKAEPISKLKVGDKVEAADPNTGKDIGGRAIQHVWINHDTDLLDLTVDDGRGHTSVIHTTASHPFWDDTTHTWVRADHLNDGHKLASSDGAHPTVAGIKATLGAANRWNLTVQQLHTYYVMAEGMPLLVHNTCGDPYGPGNPGPLPDDIAKTFTGGSYTEVTTSAPTTLYRVYGGTAREMGGYWSRTMPSSSAQAVNDSALDPAWGNTAENWVSIEVPSGTTFYEGTAAPQGALSGGGSQVFFTSRVDPAWVTDRGTLPPS